MENNFAWCTLVMLNERYAAGAVVVAESLRQVGTKYPIYCMVANVSAKTTEFLGRHFDKIIEVPLYHHTCNRMKTAKQQQIYGKWIEYSFTKCNILDPKLFSNDKIIFLDADMYFEKNCDELFDMSTPAQTFSSPWLPPYAKGTFPNPYYKNNRELSHGELVPADSIREGMRNSIVGLGNMILVSPNAKLFNKFKQLMSANNAYGNSRCMSGFDEQMFADIFLKTSTKVYNIHQRYNWYVGKYDWLIDGSEPKSQQFYNSKPWIGIKNREDVDQSEWDDVRAWWKFADLIIEHDSSAVDWLYD